MGRLTETDQIQIRDDTTSRACLRTLCYTGITTAVTTRIISDIQPPKTIACHTAHSNIHRQTNNHACEPEVNITSNHHAKEVNITSKSRKLSACKQKHSSVVGRLTETDQIQIRDDTTIRMELTALLKSLICKPQNHNRLLPPGSSVIQTELEPLRN